MSSKHDAAVEAASRTFFNDPPSSVVTDADMADMRRAISAFLRATAKTYMGLVAVEMDAIADELEQP